MMTSPIAPGVSNLPEGSSVTFLLSTSSRPPGSVMLREERACLQARGLHSVFGQPLLRIVEIDFLGQYTAAIYLGHFWRALKCPLNQGGEIIQLAVRVLFAGHRRQPGFRFLRIADECCVPGIGMNLRTVKTFLHDALTPGAKCGIIQLGYSCQFR